MFCQLYLKHAVSQFGLKRKISCDWNSEPSATDVFTRLFVFFLFTISVFVNLSIECLYCKKKKENMLLTGVQTCIELSFNLNLVRSRQSATSVWNKKCERWRLWSESSEKRWRTQWQHSFVCFSQSLTSKRDITLFLNKHFFCDKRLRLWFNICFISQQYRFSIYSRHRGVQLSPTERERVCVCVCVCVHMSILCVSLSRMDTEVPLRHSVEHRFACRAHKWSFWRNYNHTKNNLVWVCSEGFRGNNRESEDKWVELSDQILWAQCWMSITGKLISITKI